MTYFGVTTFYEGLFLHAKLKINLKIYLSMERVKTRDLLLYRRCQGIAFQQAEDEKLPE